MTLKSSVYGLIQSQIGTETLIFADQNSPRPASPYWTMRVSTQRSVGIDSYGQGVTIDGDQKVNGVREATIQLQRIGVDSDVACNDLRNNLSKTTVLDAWQVQKVALYDIGDVQNVPMLLDNSKFEPRANMDLFVRFGIELIDRVGVIETVETSAGYITNQTPDEVNNDLSQIYTVLV